MFGQFGGQFLGHPFKTDQVFGDVLQFFFGGDRLGQKDVTGAVAQLVDNILVQTVDFQHFGQRHVSHLFQRREPLFDQQVGEFLVNIQLFHEGNAGHGMLGLGLLRRLILGHQVDGPLRQLGSQANVLATATDGDGEIILVDHHVHGVLFLIDHDGGHFGRRQRTNDELRRIGRPQHDVDIFAADLVAHGGDARTAQTDAGADRIDARIIGLDSNLCAQTRIAGAGLQLHQAIGNFRHFEIKQLDDELGCGTRQDDLRAACIAVDAQQIGLDAVADAQVFLGNHLVARQQGFDLASLDDGVTALHALDGAGDDVLAATQEVGQNLLALGIADFLQDDLLGRLGTDTTEVDGFQRLLEKIAGFDVRIALLSL